MFIVYSTGSYIQHFPVTYGRKYKNEYMYVPV